MREAPVVGIHAADQSGGSRELSAIPSKIEFSVAGGCRNKTCISFEPKASKRVAQELNQPQIGGSDRIHPRDGH
jgi:hypothetical protein